MYITTASSQAETAYQLFMKETRATNTSLPKGKEAMVLIGEMWSKLPVGRRRPVRSFVQRHRCRTASETFTRPHRKRKRAPIKIGQRSPGKNTKKSSPSTTLARKLPRKPTPQHQPQRRFPPRSARARAARRKRWRSGVTTTTGAFKFMSTRAFPHKEVYLCDFTVLRSTQKKKKSKKKDSDA